MASASHLVRSSSSFSTSVTFVLPHHDPYDSFSGGLFDDFTLPLPYHIPWELHPRFTDSLHRSTHHKLPSLLPQKPSFLPISSSSAAPPVPSTPQNLTNSLNESSILQSPTKPVSSFASSKEMSKVEESVILEPIALATQAPGPDSNPPQPLFQDVLPYRKDNSQAQIRKSEEEKRNTNQTDEMEEKETKSIANFLPPDDEVLSKIPSKRSSRRGGGLRFDSDYLDDVDTPTHTLTLSSDDSDSLQLPDLDEEDDDDDENERDEESQHKAKALSHCIYVNGCKS